MLNLKRLAQSLDHTGRYFEDMMQGQPSSRILQLPFEISDSMRTRCAIADRRDSSHVLHLGTDWLAIKEQSAMEDKLILAFYALKQLQPRLRAASGPPPLDVHGADGLLPQVPLMHCMPGNLFIYIVCILV